MHETQQESAIFATSDSTWTPFPTAHLVQISSRAALPLKHERNIGRGSSAVIELVSHAQIPSEKFALKTFRRHRGRPSAADKRAFENEVAIMKRLASHRHIVTVLASYISDVELGIVMSPAASDGDLAAYLFRALEREAGVSRQQERVLNQAFGCLVSGLAYIHRHTIRHKDIKPQNILVHHGSVIYTDFGIAFDAEHQDTTTFGYAGACTPRYCAPEVSEHTSRNRKSDVFSLGCVFVEMLDVLEPELGLREMDSLAYVAKLDKVREVLAWASETGRERAELLGICHAMLEPNQKKRVDTGDVLRRMISAAGRKDRLEIEVFCKDCKLIVSCKEGGQEELEEELAALTLDCIPANDVVSSAFEPVPELEKAPVISAKKVKIKKKKPAKLIQLDEEDKDKPDKDQNIPIQPFRTVKKTSKSTASRLYCTLCNEFGHSKRSCPNECWTCGELYHKSSSCPNKCWTCDEFGHFARDCPLQCDACGESGHTTEDCPDACWTCGEVGHFKSECPDECFVCGKRGHATWECKGRCHGCGRTGHWRKECGDACFECGEVGHWAAECPNKKKKGRRGETCFNCGEQGHRAAQCQKKKKGWTPIFDQVPQGPYRVNSRR